MGNADDFIKSFFKEHPEAESGKLNLEEINKLINQYQQKLNSAPLEDFDGLSPEQMHLLLHAPLLPGSLLRFREPLSDEVLDQIPFFKLTEILLAEIKKAGKLKLTVRGNLPVDVCTLLFNQQLISWEYIQYLKLIREDNIPYISPLKQYLLSLGLVKKRNNSLSLTKNGEQYLQQAKVSRFFELFLYFINDFNWDNNGSSTNQGGHSGKLGWAYTLVLLSRYGDQSRNSAFYGSKMMQAFEKKLWDHLQADKQDKESALYQYHYAFRFFEVFANWFGLVNIERSQDFGNHWFKQYMITKTALFGQLFEVDHVQRKR